MMTAHAKLSASGAHRWMACPGSVSAEAGLPDKASSFAEEGTIAHDIAERALRLGFNCDTLCDRPDLAHIADPAQVYVDYVRALPGKHRFIETRVDFGEWVQGGFGTADAIVIDEDAGTLHIADLKFGKGVRVDANHNPQAMLYALGAYSMFSFLHEIERIKIAIVQPRIDNISEWDISVHDLLKWGEIARAAAELTAQPNAKRVPGEKQCRFCKAKADCPALYKLTEQTLLIDFDEYDEPVAPNKLTDEQLAEALKARPVIEAWLNAVETLVKQRLSTGEPFPGWKLVEGRANRAWIDEDNAAKELEWLVGDKAFVRKLITPAQAEKALGKEHKKAVESLAFKPQGKAALAPENDPRPSITISADDFDEVIDEE
jgi:hypothetical protein